MSERKEFKKKYTIVIQIAVLITIVLLSSLPVFRGRMYDTGESLLWCFRMARLLPTALVEPICLAAIIILRVLLVVVSYLFFYVLNCEEGDFFDTISGVILISFCPYQLYVAFEKTDITDMILWILIILFASVTLLIVKAAKDKKTVRIIAFVSLDVVILCGMVMSYLLSHVSEAELSFKERGYVFGSMCTSFFYQEDHPGFGIALIFAILLWVYYRAVGFQKKSKGNVETVFLILAFSFMFLSSIYFPWNVLLRYIPLLGKVIYKLEAPTIFLGLSSFCFSVPAARGLSYSRKSKNEYVSKVIYFLILFLAISIGVFINYQYILWQHPLGFEIINQ